VVRKNNEISTFEPGRRSVLFPTAPAGILFPGDPGVSRTLAPAGNFDFAPASAWLIHRLLRKKLFWERFSGDRGNQRTSRFRMYYTAIEALTLGILAGNAPFGITYTSPSPPLFATPFITAATGQNLGQPFPVALATRGASRSHPDANVDWRQYEPISGIPGYAASNRIPYVEEYMLSLERQLGANTVWAASFVGTQAHRLLVIEEANPGDPALCLSLSQPNAVAPGFPNLWSIPGRQCIHDGVGPDHRRYTRAIGT